MNKKILKILVMAASLLVIATLLVGCSGGSGSTNDSEGTSQDGASNDGGTIAGLPVTISSNGNSYTISALEVTEDDAGNTVISCEGNGFDVLPFKNNAIVIPVYCSVLVNGTETEFVSFSTKDGNVDFIFDKKLDPDTVVFYPQDSKSDRTELSLK